MNNFFKKHLDLINGYLLKNNHLELKKIKKKIFVPQSFKEMCILLQLEIIYTDLNCDKKIKYV
jgi:hypothetical protein